MIDSPDHREQPVVEAVRFETQPLYMQTSSAVNDSGGSSSRCLSRSPFLEKREFVGV